MTTQTNLTSPMKTSLEHLKHHITYPSDRKALVEACNNMSDVAEGDRKWFTANLPEGTYRTADDVVKAVLTKI